MGFVYTGNRTKMKSINYARARGTKIGQVLQPDVSCTFYFGAVKFTSMAKIAVYKRPG